MCVIQYNIVHEKSKCYNTVTIVTTADVNIDSKQPGIDIIDSLSIISQKKSVPVSAQKYIFAVAPLS